MTHHKILLRRQLGVLVPGADGLTVIATIDAIADSRSQRGRDRALELDGEIGNTAPRIQLIRRDDGTRWTGLQALRAGAAMSARLVIDCTGIRSIRCLRQGLGQRQLQRQIGKQFTQKKERAGIARQHQRVLAAPAQAGTTRQLDLHHRCRVTEHAIAERSDGRADAISQLLQTVPHQLVIVAAQGIAGDHRLRGGQALRLPRQGQRRWRQIVHTHSYHRARTRHQLRRLRAHQTMAFHIIHLAMKALLQPLLQALPRTTQIHARHAQGLKPQFGGPLPDLGQQVFR